MNYQELQVPVQYRYLSNWTDLLKILPQTGKYILNKVSTGCGGTTLFLESPYPCIMVSPRSNVLYSKAGQFPNAHLFRKKTDTSTSVLTLKQRLRDYINLCTTTITPFGLKQPTPPKILVTIDSYPHVAEQLSFMGLLDKFTVLVDEFQCLMSDSKFKGRTELEFLHNLRGVKSVCYMSATPIDESYLQHFPDFNDVSTYYKLIWDESVLEPSNLDMRPYKPRQSSKSICKDIIQGYRQTGCFAQKMINGQVVSSREVVIFLNDVRTILQVTRENNLPPDNVNVLCSPSNRYIPDLKRLGVHIGELCTDKTNPVNRTFTFATRASFEGVDFYSTNAFTYIFSDGILDWNKHDLIIDVPQVLGRQRLEQPFRKDAVLYYRTDSKGQNEATLERVRIKENATRKWIDKYNASDDQTKMMLKDGIDKRSDKSRYSDDYVEFVDDLNGGFVVRENYLVKSTEVRDWQLSEYVYNNPLSVFRTLGSNTNINLTYNYGNTLGATTPLATFLRDFFASTTFPEKMRLYCEIREIHPEYDNDLYQNSFIHCCFHQAFNLLGGDKIRALRYREKDIMEATSSALLTQQIAQDCMSAFIPGQFYLLSDVKALLQRIYNNHGITDTAKACDIVRYFPHAVQRQLTTKSTGKRELYYEIKN